MPIPLSIIIKTFERPAALRNLLRSIAQSPARYPILIADDSTASSEAAVRQEFASLPITYINLPFDTGLSEDRNVLVDRVGTEYFLLCDDDFAFDEKTDLERAFAAVVDNRLDILGGEFYNYVSIPGFEALIRHLAHPRALARFLLKRPIRTAYVGNFTIGGGSCELSFYNSPRLTGITRCDVVNNFFIARTDAVRSIGGWDKELKQGEHEDFFLRAKKAGLKVAFLPGFATAHYPTTIAASNRLYSQFRARNADFKKVLPRKHGFARYVERDADRDRIVFTASAEP